MELIARVLCVVCVGAAALADGGEFPSPCPDQFQYDGTENPQQWVGTLKIFSDDELHGLWIRVKFDAPIKELVLGEKFGGETVSRSPINDEYLIKNSDYVLKGKTKTNIKITVKYEGNKVPRLIGYRLNARTVCPEQTGDATKVFENDINTKDFVNQVLQPYHPVNLPKFECGLIKDKSAPWHAALFFNQANKKPRFLCEGTLITPKHLLTAAHCVFYLEQLAPTQLSVSFGKADLKHDVKAKLESGVARINVHPGYKFANLVNDIAIVELKAPVAIDDSIRPICLPQQDGELNGKKDILVGYKLDKNFNVESKLDSIDVKEIKNVDCERRVSDLNALIGDNVYCATYTKDESGCVGDSGSSLASLRGTDNRWELRGIVTLGVALQNKFVCNSASTVLLSDISKHIRWIRAATL